MKCFDIAGGSVAGTDHIRSGKNNQDAYHWIRAGDNRIIAVVCDGCGSQPHSEVGAKLGAQMIANCFVEDAVYSSNQTFREIKNRLVYRFHGLIQEISKRPRYEGFIAQHLLFTIVGVVIDPDKTRVFSMGDGLFYVNGERTLLQPMEGNAPPYFGYNLIDPSSRTMDIPPDLLDFQSREYDTDAVDSLLLGSDGVEYLENASELNIPGKKKPVGPVSQFWEDEKYVQNRFNIQRRLFMINKEVVKMDREANTIKREKGHLPDDTTIVVIRRNDEA